LDPLQIGKVLQETLLHYCQNLWLACKTYSRSLSYYPRYDKQIGCGYVTCQMFLPPRHMGTGGDYRDKSDCHFRKKLLNMVGNLV
jgi:hypothetical protein